MLEGMEGRLHLDKIWGDSSASIQNFGGSESPSNVTQNIVGQKRWCGEDKLLNEATAARPQESQ